MNTATSQFSFANAGQFAQQPRPMEPRSSSARTSAANLANGNLIDPITAKERNIHHVPVDKVLEYNTLDNVAYSLKTLFVTLPKTVMKGLRGDSDFSFSDFMMLSQIPYYLGGLCLTGSFLAGKDKFNAVKQGVGVGLYYLGVMSANKLINVIYQKRYGVDLDLKYRRADGRVEKVFASVDFPRFDLLTPKQYREMQDRMGIPTTVADRDQACREQLFRVIGSSRTMKLLLGNVLAAVGAGFIARSDAWGRLLGNQGTFRKIWTDPLAGGLINRLANSFEALKSLVRPAVLEKTIGAAHETAPWLRRLTWGSVAAIVGLCLLESMNVIKAQRYESSPVTLLPRGDNWLQEGSLFKRFQVYQEGGARR